MHIPLLLMLSHFFFSPMPLDYGLNQSDAVVKGVVLDESTGRGVPGATVYAMSDEDVRQTTSDADGKFVFITLLPGTYRLCASKSGYAIDCNRGTAGELAAGFQYGATVVLATAIR